MSDNIRLVAYATLWYQRMKNHTTNLLKYGLSQYDAAPKSNSVLNPGIKTFLQSFSTGKSQLVDPDTTRTRYEFEIRDCENKVQFDEN